jgi:hypothetical protein
VEVDELLGERFTPCRMSRSLSTSLSLKCKLMGDWGDRGDELTGDWLIGDEATLEGEDDDEEDDCVEDSVEESSSSLLLMISCWRAKRTVRLRGIEVNSLNTIK